jgi:glycosyltransferase involved in cell wall biosynthesis
MESNPLVSIALCTFNGEAYLPVQLDSILAQTYSRLEVVVLDDGSTDATVGMLEDYARRDSRIRLHRNPQRLGFIRNFERAITLCTGELIALSDQDDIWHPEKIERLLRHLNGHTLVYHDSELIDAEGKALGKRIRDLGAMLRGQHPLAFIFGNCVSGHSLLFRRELVPHLQPFPTCFYHDQWLALIASSLGTIDFVEDCLVQYRRHESAAFQQLARQSSRRGQRRRGAQRARDFVAGEENYLARIAIYAQHPACAEPRTMNRLLRLYRKYMNSYFSPGLATFLLTHPEMLFFLFARRPLPSLARLGWVLRHTQGVRLRSLMRRFDLKGLLGFAEDH